MIQDLAGSAVQYVAQTPGAAVTHAKRAVGRLAGLGGTDLDAVQQKGFPAWMWIVLGFAGGMVGGAYLATRFPHRVPDMLRGGRR